MLDTLAALAKAPDWTVLSKAQAAQCIGTSIDTLNRLDERGKGPKRVQLSPRRVGYTIGALREWLQSRTALNVRHS